MHLSERPVRCELPERWNTRQRSDSPPSAALELHWLIIKGIDEGRVNERARLFYLLVVRD